MTGIHNYYKSGNRLPSFTIIELVVSLLISAIIVGIVYYAYFLFSHQLADHRSRSSELHAFQLFTAALENDFEHAGNIRDTLDRSGLVLDYPDHHTSYSFTDPGMTRAVNGINEKFPVQGKIQEIEYLNDSVKLIQEIRLLIKVNKEWVPLYLNKHYSSQQLMLAEKFSHD